MSGNYLLLTAYTDILLSTINNIQGYTIFFITVNVLHVSGGVSAHHQELKTVHTASGNSKQANAGLWIGAAISNTSHSNNAVSTTVKRARSTGKGSRSTAVLPQEA
jgi:hypothetical protein